MKFNNLDLVTRFKYKMDTMALSPIRHRGDEDIAVHYRPSP
jgi:hypothetical protein